MAWGRQIELVVEDPNAVPGSGVLISDLHIEFEVERSLTLAENTAKFLIYNAKAETREKLLFEGNSLIFKAGYLDEGMSTIFAGLIWTASTSKDGPDYKTEITAVNRQSSKQSLKSVTISATYNKGTFISKVLQDIGATLGLVVNGLPNAQIPLPNGGTFVGSINNALRYVQDILANYDLAIRIDNDEMLIYKVGEASHYTVVYLNPESGLLSVKDITQPPKAEEVKKKKKAKVTYKIAGRKRLAFKSLLNPKLQVNAPVTFQTDRYSGTYIVEKLKYKGNNFGGDFFVEGEVAE